MNKDFKPTLQQHKLFKTFGNQAILEVLYGGAAGGGKSYGLWSLIILKALEYNGIRIGLARQTLSQIKNNTMSTFYEVANDFGLLDTHYNYNENKGQIKFYNGSIIQFFELRYLPSDPFYDRFGGALLTFGVIEEAAGCDAKGKEVFSSRLGRWMNDIYNIPPHLYLSTNPGTNFVYSDFYIPYTKNILESFRRYIPAKLNDNKYQSKYYADALLKRLGEANAKRLLRGEWNFDDDSTRLMLYENINLIFDYPKLYKPRGEMYLTADIAFTGDRCIIILWQGLDIIKIYNYIGELKEGTKDEYIRDPEKELVKLAELHKVKQHHIAYDADGVGKYLKANLPRSYDIINNSKPVRDENYANLKAQLNFKLADLINEGRIKCMDDSFKELQIQELYEIKSPPLETVDGKLKIVPKSEVKKIIGRSPDIADAMAFRMIFELRPPAEVPTTSIPRRR